MPYSIADLRRRLSLLDAHVKSAEEQVAAAEEQVRRTRENLSAAKARRDGAELFIAELEAEFDTDVETSSAGLTPQPVPAATKPGNKAVIEGVLRDYPQGIHIGELQRVVRRLGVDLNDEQVRSAVTYLKRTGRARNLARGVWQPVSADSTDLDSLADARPSISAPLLYASEAEPG